MKIVLLSFEYPPETGFGGIGTYTWIQARALAKLGHEVHVLAGALQPTALSTVLHDGVMLHRYRSTGLGMRIAEQLGRHRMWWTQNRLETGLSMYEGLKRLCRDFLPDIIEMPECGGEGLLVTRRFDTPTVVRFHSPAALIMPFYDVRRADRNWCARLERRGYSGAHAFSACTRFMSNEVRNKLGVDAPVEVIPNGIDLARFDEDVEFDAREAFDLPKDRPLLLFSGRIEPRKGIEVCRKVVAAILERHDVSMVFVGRDLFGHLESEILSPMRSKRLRGSIHALGGLDQQGVRACLRACDVFLLPSLWENQPYACLEAMAARRPIVSSDCGGIPEMLQDGESGILVKTGDASAFISGIERLLDDPPLRTRLGNEARRVVEERFDDAAIASRSVEFYARCISGSQRAKHRG